MVAAGHGEKSIPSFTRRSADSRRKSRQIKPASGLRNSPIWSLAFQLTTATIADLDRFHRESDGVGITKKSIDRSTIYAVVTRQKRSIVRSEATRQEIMTKKKKRDYDKISQVSR